MQLGIAVCMVAACVDGEAKLMLRAAGTHAVSATYAFSSKMTHVSLGSLECAYMGSRMGVHGM